MKKIFIKDDRIRDIEKYLSDQITKLIKEGKIKITKLIKEGKIKGSYSSELSWRKVETKEFPGYICQYGWEVTDYEDGWKFDDLTRFTITVERDKKYGNYYFVECEKIWEENATNTLMGCGKTLEGALLNFLKRLRERKKMLCVNGASIYK